MTVSKTSCYNDLKTEKKKEICSSTQKIRRFEIWITRHFVTKNKLRGITIEVGTIWGIDSLTPLSSSDSC